LPQVLLALIVEEMEGAADPAGAPLRLRLSGGPDERGLAHRRRACQAARGREQERLLSRLAAIEQGQRDLSF